MYSMDTQNSNILETCGEESVLFQTVKSIVDHNQSEELVTSETEQFFLITNIQNGQQRSMDITNEESLNDSEGKITWSNLCRICANINDHMIPIFEGEGVEHALCNKIHKYLPIHIAEHDTLPLQVCYHCAATLLAWHELVEGCLSAERKLLEIQDSLQNKQQVQLSTSDESEVLSETAAHVVQDSFSSRVIEAKDELYEKVSSNSLTRWNPNSTETIAVSTVERQDSKVSEINYLSVEDKSERKQQLKNREVSNEKELLLKAKSLCNDRISYKCELCEKAMFTKRGFVRHMRVHNNNRPCQCKLCGKCYRIEQDLARHIRDVHEGLKRYACDICGRAFANKNAKDDHRRIHTGERPYTCEHCPKTFRTLNSVYVHNRVHNDYKPHECSYCGKSFRSKQRLNNHVTTHTGVKAFSCEICGKSFAVKGEVMRHRATHNQEKPFGCNNCGLKFGQKRYLRNHIKQHHKQESSLLLAELLRNHN